MLQKLIRPVAFEAEGLIDPDYVGPFHNRENHFGDKLTLDLKPLVAGSTIRYTLDGSVPTKDSPRFTKPVLIETNRTVRTQIFGADGNKLGFIATRPYEFHPIQGTVDGLLMNVPHDDHGQPKGTLWRRQFDRIDAETNLTTGKPVTASKAEPNGKAEYAVDGIIDRDFHWDGPGGAPQWWQVDLEASHKLSCIQVVTYWDGHRHYHYRVEVSLDGETWNEVADFGKNTKPATKEGFMHAFDPLIARHIRVTMLHNSANPGLHLVEVRAYAD